MSYNGSGTFQINTTGQPVVTGTVISSSAFNALTADLATGLSTAITKDGQTTTTARIPFAAGISSTLVTDSTSTTTGSIITAGGAGIAKALYVGTTANVAGAATLGSTLTYGGVTLTNAVTGTGKMVLDTSPTITGLTANGVTATLPVINNIKMGYTTTATAAGTTTLTVSSNYRQFFTGTLAQTIVLPVTSTLVTGMAFEIENNSTGLLTVNSSGGNLVGTVPAGVCAHAVCIGTTLTTAADWDWDYISTTTITGTGANVLGTSPTITTPTIDTITSAAATALTLQSAGTTAITVNTSQNVGIGTASPAYRLDVRSSLAVLDGSANIGFYANGTSYTQIWQTLQSPNDLLLKTTAAKYIAFLPDSTERMRITSAGVVCINKTSAASNEKLTVAQVTDSRFVSFYNTTTSAEVGYIYSQVSGTSTQYSTTSDYRLKEDIVPMIDALAKVAQLKPVTYKWKINGSEGQGFIAHELQEVVPDCVIGKKDEIDADGNPVHQGIDTSFLVATLTAAIQEQQTLITALTARITALENK